MGWRKSPKSKPTVSPSMLIYLVCIWVGALFLFLLHVFSSYIIVLDRKINVFEVIVSLSESLDNGNFLMREKDHDITEHRSPNQENLSGLSCLLV